MRQEYHAVQHTLNWYCLDYWSERLGLDICAMTSEQGPRAPRCARIPCRSLMRSRPAVSDAFC